MTTSDTLIGQALAGAGPGGLRGGWEASREAERPGAGSSATASAPQRRRCHLGSSNRSSSSGGSARGPRNHNTLHFRLPAAVAQARGRAGAEAAARWAGGGVRA